MRDVRPPDPTYDTKPNGHACNGSMRRELSGLFVARMEGYRNRCVVSDIYKWLWRNHVSVHKQDKLHTICEKWYRGDEKVKSGLKNRKTTLSCINKINDKQYVKSDIVPARKWRRGWKIGKQRSPHHETGSKNHVNKISGFYNVRTVFERVVLNERCKTSEAATRMSIHLPEAKTMYANACNER